MDAQVTNLCRSLRKLLRGLRVADSAKVEMRVIAEWSHREARLPRGGVDVRTGTRPAR